ncbi:agmatine deiminase family protein [Collimonas pratensis]|uniref:agmatine deiminase family protein n=1 Tax=Collimonas pratensis TaxID=279113 RepID=UPI003B8A8915
MSSRRGFLQKCSAGGGAFVFGGLLTACGSGTASTGLPEGVNDANDASRPQGNGGQALPRSGWTMRDEGDAHKATWMAFVASDAIWEAWQVAPVQDALARIANAIVQFEPVNMLVNQRDLAIARQKLDPRVTLLVAGLDDLWIRDTGPVFVMHQNGEKAGVNFNFNGWGKKQVYANDGKVAGFITQQAGVRMLPTRLVLEGGGIEVDGKGTAIITESCVLNPNRNPGLSKADCEAELNALLGIRKVIWLPGIAGKDITDGHTDFYARFARPGVVVAGFDPDPASYDNAVTTRHLQILRAATDANGQPLQVVTIEAPGRIRPEFASKTFAPGYINFYLVNGALIMPEFGDAAADANAKARYMELFPGRAIVQLNIDPIAAGGGGIHCTTQQQPA